MRYCDRCGNQVKSDDVYCEKCGHEIDSSNAATYTPPTIVLPQEKKDNVAALTGFVCALFAPLCCGFTTVPGFIISLYGFFQRKSCYPEREGYALCGIIVSGILLLIPLMLFIMYMIFGISILGELGSRSSSWGY